MQGIRMLFRPLQLPCEGSMPGWMPNGGTRLEGTSVEEEDVVVLLFVGSGVEGLAWCLCRMWRVCFWCLGLAWVMCDMLVDAWLFGHGDEGRQAAVLRVRRAREMRSGFFMVVVWG